MIRTRIGCGYDDEVELESTVEEIIAHSSVVTGMRSSPRVKKPKMPSQPTACNGGMLYFPMKRSSYTTWKLVNSMPTSIKASPAIFSVFVWLPSGCLEKRMSDTPTTAKPDTTVPMPSQWTHDSFFRRNRTLKRDERQTRSSCRSRFRT